MTANTDPQNQVRADTAATEDRRAAERHRCLCECLVRMEGAPLVADWPGMVYNISAGGVGLALPFPAPTGAVLLIQRRTAPRGERAFRARVTRSRLQGYVWFHGCAFLEPLGDEELRAWLEETRGPAPG
jgi:hypothetical protein